jgi:hypothetical protein
VVPVTMSASTTSDLPKVPATAAEPPVPPVGGAMPVTTGPSGLPRRVGPGPAASLYPGGAVTSMSGLPRRRPGEQLAPTVAPAPTTATPRATVDPEAVRARLSAFAEGVSAALRGRPDSTQSSKDQ